VSAQGRIVALAVAMAALVGGFWFGAIAPKRADSAKLREQISQAQARRQVAVAAAASADQARRSYEQDYETVARLGKAVPTDDDVASLVYQLESVARANKIDFRAAKLSAGAAPATAPGATALGSTPPIDSGSGSGKAKTDAKTDPTAAPAVAQAPSGAAVGPAGLLTLPFTFTLDGGYLHMQRMLGAMNGLADATNGVISVRGRLLTVDGFSLTASRFGFPKVKAQVSATAYVAPAAEGVAGAAALPGQAATATATAPKPGDASSSGLAPVTATASIPGVGR
jgi:hypothetical protein